MKPAIFAMVFFWVMMPFQLLGTNRDDCRQNIETGRAAIEKAETSFKAMERQHRQKRMMSLKEMALTKSLISQAKKSLGKAEQLCAKAISQAHFDAAIAEAKLAREKAAEAARFHMKRMKMDKGQMKNG